MTAEPNDLQSFPRVTDLERERAHELGARVAADVRARAVIERLAAHVEAGGDASDFIAGLSAPTD